MPSYADSPASQEWVKNYIYNPLQSEIATLQAEISGMTTLVPSPNGTITISGNVISGNYVPQNNTITISGNAISSNYIAANNTITVLGNTISSNYIGGTGITIQGNTISATGTTGGHFIGECYQGGVIFWLDPTKSIGQQSGLIAAIADESSNLQWAASSSTTNATLNGAYTGNNGNTALNPTPANGNTNIILNSSIAGSAQAAQVCSSYGAGGYSDWYLPSIMELSSMFVNQMIITTTATTGSSSCSSGSPFQAIGGPSISPDYWSSTEANNNDAWAMYFDLGMQVHLPKTNNFNVRCIRAFQD